MQVEEPKNADHSARTSRAWARVKLKDVKRKLLFATSHVPSTLGDGSTTETLLLSFIQSLASGSIDDATICLPRGGDTATEHDQALAVVAPFTDREVCVVGAHADVPYSLRGASVFLDYNSRVFASHPPGDLRLDDDGNLAVQRKCRAAASSDACELNVSESKHAHCGAPQHDHDESNADDFRSVTDTDMEVAEGNNNDLPGSSETEQLSDAARRHGGFANKSLLSAHRTLAMSMLREAFTPQ